MKFTVRIARQKYSYLEVEGDEESKINKKTDDIIHDFLALIDKYTLTDTEVIMFDKKCPKCSHNLLEAIGISDKNSKPYHRLKCSNKECDYIHWINVGFKGDFKE